MFARNTGIALIVTTLLFAGTLAAQTAVEGAVVTQQTTAPAAQQPTAPVLQQPNPQQTPTPPMPSGGVPAPEGQAPQQTTLAAASTAPLRVMVGKSLLVNTTERLKRVSVTDPAVADALVVTPNQILVHGRAPGEVTLIIWDEQERSRSFDLRVDVDVTAASEEIHRIFPQQKIDVSASRGAIVLSGQVTSKEIADRMAAVAGAYSKNVVNVLTWGAVGAQEVLLEVKFAEVDRTALLQLGMNIISTGAANTIGAIQPGQFGSIGAGNNQIRGGIPGGLQGAQATFQTSDLLNIFLFRTDLNLAATIRALQVKNVLQILAEPNLIAVNGKEASFLAGGEFPFPVVQGGIAGTTSVTIQFKEFGVRLKFTPLIQPDGNIYLQVAPEVSSLDFANGLQITGFNVPAISTRRAQTEFELQDGQSFVIAGLLDNRLTDVVNKIPGLGDLPVLGNLFKSKNLQKNKTELMVLVTAHRISPSSTPPPFPKYPEQFMNPDQGKPATGGK